jgi:oligosaccharide reducing-end xylanase
MMLAVQMNDHTLFDKLYAFVQTYMLFKDTSGSYAYANGYHRWRVNADGTANSGGNGVAPDGEQWFAAALSLAARRWSSGGYNYATEASTLWHRLMYPVNAYGGFCIDPTSTNAGYHIVRFGPYNAFTDPSYIVPGFYALAADTVGGADATAYADIYSKGHSFLQYTPANPSNSNQNWGLHPDYADWNGNPVQSSASDQYGPIFSYDAYRTTMNMAIDLGWTGNGTGYYWQVASRRQDQFYYYPNTVGTSVGLGVAGHAYGQLISSGMPMGLVAANAAASALYSWANTERAWFTNKLWTGYHPTDYYGDNLYMLGLLICGGQFRSSF